MALNPNLTAASAFDAEQKTLDTFYTNSTAASSQASLVGNGVVRPPPPAGVDMRDFHSATPGGFGNEMANVAGQMTTEASDESPLQAFGNSVGRMDTDGAKRAALLGYQQYVGNSLRPWREFFLPFQKPENGQEALATARRNFVFFKTNYACLLAAYLIFNLITTPSALVLGVVLAVVWVLFLKKNEDPDWSPVIGGVTLGPSQRYMGLAGVSAILVLIFCGTLLFGSVLFFVFPAAIHALLHAPPELTDEELGPQASV